MPRSERGEWHSISDTWRASDRGVRSLQTDASAVDAGDAAQIQAWIDAKFYNDSEIVSTFYTKFGERIDCIDFYSQRSVQAFVRQGVQIDATSLPPPATPPSDVPPAIVAPGVAFTGELDQYGNPRQCPSTAVPITRPTVEQVEAAGGLALYKSATAHKPPPCGNTCTGQQTCFEHDCYLNGGQPTTTYEHATGIQTSFSSSPYGMLTYMPIYLPTVSGGEHSHSQIWMQTGQCENWYSNGGPQQCPTGNGVQNQAVQSVEAGWNVDGSGAPFAEEKLHCSAFFTADGYHNSAGPERAETVCPSGIPDAGADQQGTDCWVRAPGGGGGGGAR